MAIFNKPRNLGDGRGIDSGASTAFVSGAAGLMVLPNEGEADWIDLGALKDPIRIKHSIEESDYMVDRIGNNYSTLSAPKIEIEIPVYDQDELAMQMWERIVCADFPKQDHAFNARRIRRCNLKIIWGGGEQPPAFPFSYNRPFSVTSVADWKALTTHMREILSYEFRTRADAGFDWPWLKSIEMFDMQLQEPYLLPMVNPNHYTPANSDDGGWRRDWPESFKFTAANGIYKITKTRKDK